MIPQTTRAPDFNASIEAVLRARLTNFLSCWIHPKCTCEAPRVFPVKVLVNSYGNLTIGDVINRMKCKRCRESAQPVFLSETYNMKECNGPKPGWWMQIR